VSSYRADRSLPDLSTVAAACPLAKQPRLWAIDVAGGNGEGDRPVAGGNTHWRALLDAILASAYAKAYGHAARYLHENFA
jgi:hypothetical protein